MKTVLKVLWTIFKVVFAVAAALFVVYFWNLDQKVLDWVYNRVGGRKSADAES